MVSFNSCVLKFHCPLEETFLYQIRLGWFAPCFGIVGRKSYVAQSKVLVK